MALVARRTGPRRRMMADINVVPYVDVMLVLVVILMVAAPFVNPSVVDLPSVAKAGPQKEVPVRIVVRSDGRISIIEANKGETPVPAGQLIALVKSRRKTAESPVVIEADAKVQYKSVLDVMRELQTAKIERVGLLVQVAK
jgi:biopolymer transport protein TolR